MKINQAKLPILLFLVILGIAGYAFWKSQSSRGKSPGERKVAFYQDSMHPWIKSDRPGKCTICDMDLTAIYEGQSGFGGDNLVVIGSNQVTVLNVQTEPAKRRQLNRRLRVAGTLEANETSKVVISSPARGRIDALTVDYAGVEVQEGQKLITLFSPELVQLRRTLLAVREVGQPGATNTMSKALVDSGIYTGDILAPKSGVVLERNVYNGQYVAEGDRLLTIADASVLWFRFDVYQDQLPWFGLGQPLEVTVSGIPGKVFPAVITFVEPNFNDATRTVKVRADIRNPVVEVGGVKQRALKYGMYAEGRVQAEAANVLAIPRTAILFPGGSAYAYVEKGSGAYERRRLKLGSQGDDYWEVLAGIEEDENVVTSGNTLIDAQAQFTLANADEGRSAGEAAEQEAAEHQGAWAGIPRHEMAASKETSGAAVTDPPRQAMTAPAAMAPMGANQAPQPATKEHAAGRRTQLMSAIMSPGSELQLKRRETILAELQQKAGANTNGPGGNPSAAASAAAMAGEAGTSTETAEMRTAVASGSGQKAAEPLYGIMAAQTPAPAPAPAATFPSQINYQQLQYLVLEVDAISGALASDDLAQFKAHVARLPAVLAPVQKEFCPQLHWETLLEPLAALSQGEPPKDLEQARSRFLPFSTGVVALSKRIKQDLPAFPKLKIYHCPMAAKPGLWMQTQAPLRNPFFGAKMLKCGEEVPQ